MTNTLLSEFLIAVFAGMLAVAIMRKNTPRPVELLLWVGLIWVCVLGVTDIRDPQARDLTSAAFWGAVQMLGSLVTLGALAVEQWLAENRFVLADAAVLIVGMDLLVLAFLMSRRQAAGWQPRVRLRDWMELPRMGAEPKPAPVTLSAVDDVNRRFNLWAPVAAAAAFTWTTFFLIWTGDVAVPTVGRRIRKAAVTAEGARRRVAQDAQRVLDEQQVVHIGEMSRRAAAIRARAAGWLTEAGTTPEANWLGGFGVTASNASDGGNESDGTERDRRDKLAS